MTKNEALRLALEALERSVATCLDPYSHEQVKSHPKHFINQTIIAIKEALETKDEPVAWGMEKDGVILDVICPAEHEREEGGYTVPLYTTPQPNQEQGEPVIRETASEHMTDLLMTFVDIAMMFPTQKPDSYAWEKVLIFAPNQEQGEPVAWMNRHGACKTSLFMEVEAGAKEEYTIPVYTAPPQRTWVGLEVDEFKFIASKYLLNREAGLEYFQEEIESKLKEKNNAT